MKVNLKDQIATLHQTYKTRQQKAVKTLQLKSNPIYKLNGSGCRQKSQLMQLPAFRMSVCLSLLSVQLKQCYSIMVTASHNPACDNGIKIGYTNTEVIPQEQFQGVESTLNDQGKFQEFVNKRLQKYQECVEQNRNIICYIGRDCRSSSPLLSRILCEVLETMGVHAIDLGACSTPQLFSLSQYIYLTTNGKLINKDEVIQYRKSYVQQVMTAFSKVYQQLLSSSSSKQNSKIPQILLDFSNGSGAISILPYQSYLNKHFKITKIHNDDFNNPNLNCGADFYSKNWNLVSNGEQFAKYDQCFFFDGDSDRIVGKISNNKQIKQQNITSNNDGYDLPFDGNCFIVYYTQVVTQIVNKLLKMYEQHVPNENVFKINAVGTVVMNLGVRLAIKKMGAQFHTSDVGTLNLYRVSEKQQGISVFFQPNGHGGIYFSKNTLQKMKQLSLIKITPQLNFLQSIYTILRNNSRGYGLHNMLIYYLCKQYIPLELPLFTLTKQQSKNIRIPLFLDPSFKNGKQLNNNQIVQPYQIYDRLKYYKQKYTEYQIVVRKSQTEKGLIRAFVQGIDNQVCKAVIQDIEIMFEEYIQKFQHI